MLLGSTALWLLYRTDSFLTQQRGILQREQKRLNHLQQTTIASELGFQEKIRALLVTGNSPYGFDRVMALYPDNRAYVWPQINACGTAHFDGDPLPADCPPPPTR